jgi:anti-sigma regulatory factor (Ser/Thr protein kinase)
MSRVAVAESFGAGLDAFALRCGAEGFTFDDLVTAAAEHGQLAAVADWLARAHRRGDIVEIGAPRAEPGELAAPTRYAVVTEAVSRPRLELCLPAETRALRAMRWAATKFALTHRVADPQGVELAVSEAVSNAIRHAYDGEATTGDVRLVACAQSDGLVIVVRDWGPHGMQPRLDTPGLGLGLPVIAQLTDRLEIEPADGGGTLVRMQFAYATNESAAG